MTQGFVQTDNFRLQLIVQHFFVSGSMQMINFVSSYAKFNQQTQWQQNIFLPSHPLSCMNRN